MPSKEPRELLHHCVRVNACRNTERGDRLRTNCHTHLQILRRIQLVNQLRVLVLLDQHRFGRCNAAATCQTVLQINFHVLLQIGGRLLCRHCTKSSRCNIIIQLSQLNTRHYQQSLQSFLFADTSPSEKWCLMMSRKRQKKRANAEREPRRI